MSSALMLVICLNQFLKLVYINVTPLETLKSLLLQNSPCPIHENTLGSLVAVRQTTFSQLALTMGKQCQKVKCCVKVWNTKVLHNLERADTNNKFHHKRSTTGAYLCKTSSIFSYAYHTKWFQNQQKMQHKTR